MNVYDYVEINNGMYLNVRHVMKVFKVGDKVKCINDIFCCYDTDEKKVVYNDNYYLHGIFQNSFITVDKTYDVLDSNDDFISMIHIENDNKDTGWHFSESFELVEDIPVIRDNYKFKHRKLII